MRTSAKVSIFGAALFVVSLSLGIRATTLGMIRSFNSIAEPSMQSPEELAESIGNSLVSTAVGIPFAIVGLGLLVGGLIAYFRSKQRPDAIEKPHNMHRRIDTKKYSFRAFAGATIALLTIVQTIVYIIANTPNHYRGPIALSGLIMIISSLVSFVNGILAFLLESRRVRAVIALIVGVAALLPLIGPMIAHLMKS